MEKSTFKELKQKKGGGCLALVGGKDTRVAQGILKRKGSKTF